MKKYTKEQLIYFLKKCSKEHGRTPTKKDMNEDKEYPSAATYAARFGSWNTALKAAELVVNVRYVSRDELLDSLRQLRKEIDRVPKTSDLKDWMASYSTYRKYFGSWKKALEEAGIKKQDSHSLKEFIKKK